MYQSSIRDKKKHQQFNHVKNDNYEINPAYEEYAYVKKLLGNCRVSLLTNSGAEAIGIIRGSMRKFSKRVIIEVGDIVVISKRDFQDSKVDIVHKYNSDQVLRLTEESKISTILTNNLNFSNTNSKSQDDYVDNNDNYVDFGYISTDEEDEV